MDYHVAEKRQGGKHYVIDCKHYPKAILSRREVDDTLEYKRKSRASKAIILISQESPAVRFKVVEQYQSIIF